jgi:hypothetical protein
MVKFVLRFAAPAATDAAFKIALTKPAGAGSTGETARPVIRYACRMEIVQI